METVKWLWVLRYSFALLKCQTFLTCADAGGILEVILQCVIWCFQVQWLAADLSTKEICKWITVFLKMRRFRN